MRHTAVVLPVVTLIMLGPLAGARLGSPAAQDATAATDGHPITGSWRLAVTEDQALPVVALGTFGADGTVVVSPQPVVPPSPSGPALVVHTSAGHGAWEATGPDTAIFSFVLLAATDEGTSFATRTVRASVTLSPDGQVFRGAYAGTVADPAGNPIVADSGIVQATRLIAEGPGTPPAGTPSA